MILEFTPPLRDAEAATNLLTKHNIKSVHLAHKHALSELVDCTQTLREAIPDLNVMPTIALNKLPGKDSIVNESLDFLLQFKGLGCSEILIVSGHPAPKTPTVDLVNNQDFKLAAKGWSVAVATNPYGADIKTEKEKLQKKLNSGIVAEVCMQIGHDEERLQNFVDLIHSSSPSIKTSASLLVPTERTQELLQERPWYGVSLPPDWLQDVDAAWVYTHQAMALYRRNSITPIITVAPFDITAADTALTKLMESP